VLYSLYLQSGWDAALRESLKAYRAARQAWAELASIAEGVYVKDVTYGLEPQLRGHWLDRLAAIDRDIAAMEMSSGQAPKAGVNAAAIDKAIQSVLAKPQRPAAQVEHAPPASFKPGQDVPIQLKLSGSHVSSVRLWYRRVNQAEACRSKSMVFANGRYEAAIEGDYANSPFPLEYYFELGTKDGQAWLYPGFSKDFLGQPYFVVRQA
jgi:hypothetical protein